MKYNTQSTRLGMLAFATVLFSSLVPQMAHSEIWAFEPNTSVVRFAYQHLGLSRQSGRITGITGQLQFDPTQPDRGQVHATMDMATLSTGVAPLDTLLKSADFFDLARYPTATFKSTGLRPLVGDRMGELAGELTIMGVTKPVVLIVKWNFTGEHPLASVNPTYAGKWVSGFSASATISRSEFGLTRGLPLIDERVAIEIEVEFLRLG